MTDADRVRAYGAGQSAFGGVFRDGEDLVVLFTENVEEHNAAVRRIVDEPERLVIRAASRTLVEVQDARTRVSDRLFGGAGFDEVSTVGIAVQEGQFVVEVGIDPYNETQAERVRAAVHPDQVEVRARPRPRPL